VTQEVGASALSSLLTIDKVIHRNIYPLPLIQDILKERPRFKNFTKVNISMQYFTFELTDAAEDHCIIITPFGNFNYNMVPVGVKQFPDFAQEVMEDIFRNMEDVEVYIDDIGI
jgi:hypothetical protein